MIKLCRFLEGHDFPVCLVTPQMRHQNQILLPCFYSLLLSLLQPRPRDLMHHLRLIQFTASQATGSYQPDRGIFRHLETRTVYPIPSSLICPLLPSGIYVCFFYFSNHWAPASLKLIESETCLPEETLTLSIKEISDFILSIRSEDWACVFNTDTSVPISLNCRAI